MRVMSEWPRFRPFSSPITGHPTTLKLDTGVNAVLLHCLQCSGSSAKDVPHPHGAVDGEDAAGERNEQVWLVMEVTHEAGVGDQDGVMDARVMPPWWWC